jgi:xylan 1,4-beta-xylosidase
MRFQKVVAVLISLVISSASQLCWPQQAPQSVSIRVHFDQPAGPMSPVWNFFGYEEPNYTYAPNCKKLLGERGSECHAGVRADSQSANQW